MKRILIFLKDSRKNKYLHLLEPIMDQKVSEKGIVTEVLVRNVVYIFKGIDDLEGIRGQQFNTVWIDEGPVSQEQLNELKISTLTKNGVIIT